MDNNLKQQIQDRLASAQNILIVVSQKTGFDGIAAGLSLYLSIKKLGKDVSIIAKNPTVGDAQLLYGVDKIGKNDDKKDLVISVADAVKNVDKVTYFLEGDVLKIVVHAFPQSSGISTEEITFDKASTKADILFSLGFSSLEQLRSELTHEQDINSNIWIVNLNNSTPIKKFAQLDLSDPNVSGISEITANFFQLMALPADEDIAFNLYSGIASASQMFSPKVVTPGTFQAASWLLKFGAGKAGLAQSTNISHEESTKVTTNILSEQAQVQFPDQNQTVGEIQETSEEQIEREKQSQKEWLKPPKIYRGSKSFDIES